MAAGDVPNGEGHCQHCKAKGQRNSKQTDADVTSFDGGYGSAYLAKMVGQKRAREIFFLGRNYSAQEAYDMGMVNAVIPHEKLDDLLHHSSSMKEVLNYHIIPGAFDSKQLIKVSTLNTLLDQEIQVKYADGLMINKARVIKSDIIASNGIIHVIDRVLKPPEILAAV